MHEERGPEEDEAERAHDVLAAFNADEIVDDPDDLTSDQDRDREPPAATPDSPEPI